jgi:2-methylthioadenine synthetase
MGAAALAARVGETRSVLFEGAPRATDAGWTTAGYTDTFQRVAVTLPVDRRLRGRIVPVRLTAATAEQLVGALA